MVQEMEYGNDPVLNMMVGLIYYELWYANIPREMKLKSSDIYEAPMQSEVSGLSFINRDESTCCNSFDNQGAESLARADSASSVGNNKSKCMKSVGNIQREPSKQSFKPQGFYMGESSETSRSQEDNHDDNLLDTSVFKSRGLEACLLPIRLPELNENFGDSIYTYIRTLDDYYAKAVKHLKSALYSTPPVWASLLPLIQLLLLGDRVEEALKELENICETSNATLPLRIKAILLECFDSKNSIMVSTCYEDTLKKDPTCGHSLTRLITMHKYGDYGLVPLLEMIALHLDATYPACCIWEELASCFLKVSQNAEDQISVCGYADERHLTYMNMVPIRFIHVNSRKSWELRCKWWSKRHFSKNSHVSEMKAGNWDLLTCKAACASHLYGPQFEYVVSVHSYLEQAGKRDQALFLQLHMKSSVRVLEQLNSEDVVMDEQSCFSN
ncbi:Taf rna polymerase i subunit a [Thalictrum thalictroides]|uniref:Taf rna polymerase i subunit a n=1 Tax=Thalictrum thalictroides TaxID=46969 RepID=A0A7J6W287_THATH|nr:Taf rna polymerase i subunit a [Thalictrum thalictroides]